MATPGQGRTQEPVLGNICVIFVCPHGGDGGGGWSQGGAVVGGVPYDNSTHLKSKSANLTRLSLSAPLDAWSPYRNLVIKRRVSRTCHFPDAEFQF